MLHAKKYIPGFKKQSYFLQSIIYAFGLQNAIPPVFANFCNLVLASAITAKNGENGAAVFCKWN